MPTSPWPRQTPDCLNQFYGNPDANGDGVPDRAWEDANLIPITPPYQMFLAWAPTTPLKTIKVNKRCADSLKRCLAGILAHYGSQAGVEAARMHLYGGAYNFRSMRGNVRLSVHSWGAAIDLDPGANVFGQKWSGRAPMMPAEVVSIFAKEGWVWGGTWSKPDAQHFQAATI